MFCRKYLINNYKKVASYSHYKNTIYALSSGHGKCGVAVIRISGPEASNALKLMAGFSKMPKPRHAYLRSLRNSQNREIIDKGLVLWFAGPESFTGEDSCEFQIHGGLAVIKGILASLHMLPKFRLAEPGEFTKRAFFNGKLDLTEVEGLSDLLNAETEIQRKQAFLQSQGSLSRKYSEWKNVLLKNLAHSEAYIDFDESEILDENLEKIIRNNILNLRNEIENHLNDGRKGEILRSGVKTVILGKPNVGKSSLLNILCGRPAAIVTPISGTTRDVLEVKLDICGYPLNLVDTAGLRKNSSDPIECEGIRRAFLQLDEADLVLVVTDTSDLNTWKLENPTLNFKDYLKNYLKILNIDVTNNQILFVMNKIDLHSVENDVEMSLISCKTETGIDKFIDILCKKLKEICGEPCKEHPTMNNARHREHMEDCLTELDVFIEKFESDRKDVVILAEHLRRASRYLGKLVGTVTTDELLDIIFRDFCIGK